MDMSAFIITTTIIILLFTGGFNANFFTLLPFFNPFFADSAEEYVVLGLF